MNTILYGPPGTGKTYAVNTYKDTLVSDQTVTDEQYNFEGLSWRDAIYLAYKEKKFRNIVSKGN